MPLWQLAGTTERQNALRDAMASYLQTRSIFFEIPGPYLSAKGFDATNPNSPVFFPEGMYPKFYLTHISDWTVVYEPWYITGMAFGMKQGATGMASTVPVNIVSELVPGALVPVTWELIHTSPQPAAGSGYQYFWKAIPPSDDYAAMSHACSAEASGPPASLASRFRAVHKSLLKTQEFTSNAMISLAGSSVYVTDSNTVFFSFGIGKPLDTPYAFDWATAKIRDANPPVDLSGIDLDF